MIEKLTSTNNPRIKRIVHLAKAHERKAQNVIVIEGYREIRMAIEAGFSIKELYFCREVNNHVEMEALILGLQCLKFELTKALFEKVAYRSGSDGLLALAEPRYLLPDKIKLSPTPLILVLESVEKPGNLGAMLRTSDASHLDAIFVCDPQTDIFNPNVIRSSLGCVFSNQVVSCTTSEAIDFFARKKIKTFAAALTASEFYHNTDLTGPSAIVMGTEADGLSDKWLLAANTQIKIPMLGKVDSLNVSASAAILVYEAMRQRNFKKS
jgi:TrmH family RNA methyltransferase